MCVLLSAVFVLCCVYAHMYVPVKLSCIFCCLCFSDCGMATGSLPQNGRPLLHCKEQIKIREGGIQENGHGPSNHCCKKVPTEPLYGNFVLCVMYA